MKLPMRYLLVLVVPVALSALIGGCGGSSYDIGPTYTYPRTIYVTLVWKTIDADGNPIGGVTMSVDGTQSQFYTDPQFTALGRNYPYEWRGWLANWVSDEYSVVLHSPSDTQAITLTASKAGWNSASDTITFDDSDADYTFARGTFKMTPATVAPAGSLPRILTADAQKAHR